MQRSLSHITCYLLLMLVHHLNLGFLLKENFASKKKKKVNKKKLKLKVQQQECWNQIYTMRILLMMPLINWSKAEQGLERFCRMNQQTMGRNCTPTTDVKHWGCLLGVLNVFPWWSVCTLYLLHARWSYHRQLGSLLLCVCFMCDVNCSRAITSHCLLMPLNNY